MPRDEPLTSDITDQLTNLLGPDSVLAAEGYAVDGVVPQAGARPADRQGVAELLRWASANGVTVFPFGGGVFTRLGNVPSRVDVALDLSRIGRVMDYQPADLTVTTEAGITLESLRRELAQGDKYVPLEAPLPHRATVGGILATGYSGPCAIPTACRGTGLSALTWWARTEWRPGPGDGWSRTLPATT